MHFWIDKRSQACGFGRARVAASLSGNGGVGLGFGGPPRRGKSLVAPVHRFQPVDNSSRSHNVNNISNNSNSNNNSSNIHSNRTRNSNNSSGISQHYYQQSEALHQNQIHNQSGHIGGSLSGRHQNNSTGSGNSNHNLQRPNVASVNNQECHHVPVPLPHLYGSSSHSQELEQGSLGLGPIPTRPNLQAVAIAGNGVIPEAPESQLLPSHLKCGMWASLVLASVFVAGAKFYFDHQGTGLEVLIFCAFSATFFLAACTVSLCRLPRDLATSPSASVDGHSRGLDGVTHPHHSGQTGQNADHVMNLQNGPTSAPPPPYHIAILLPENSKEIQSDETPPPSYDKILI